MKKLIVLFIVFVMITISYYLLSPMKQSEKNDINKVNQEVNKPNQEKILSYNYPKSKPRNETLTDGFEELSSFKVNPISNGNKASYHLDTNLDTLGTFSNKAEIKIKNISEKEWQELVFYFIPNAFTKENKPTHIKGESEVSIQSVKVEDKEVAHGLDVDTLYLILPESIKPNDEKVVTIEYTFKVPHQGNRFSRNQENFYLAQWYPMLAPYQNGWVKEDYVAGGESYHTHFSNFVVSYKLPDNYSIFSSANDDPLLPSKSGVLTLDNSKEFYLALLKDSVVKTKQVENVQIRVVALKANEELIDDAIETASKALYFFQNHFRPYPHKQLDIILDEGGMEYPGIVTVGNSPNIFSMEHLITHEIAHQWFYGVVNSNPYYDTWIDEGLTQFATYLYFIESEGLSAEDAFTVAHMNVENEHSRTGILLAHKPLSEYQKGGYLSANYDTPALKLWEIFGDTNKSLEFLKNYVSTYAYKEIDTQEFLRYLKSYLQISENSYFSEWIYLE